MIKSNKKLLYIIPILLLILIVAVIFFEKIYQFQGVVLSKNSFVGKNGEKVTMGIGYGEDLLFLDNKHSKNFIVSYTYDKHSDRPDISIYADRSVQNFMLNFAFESSCFHSPCKRYENVLSKLYNDEGNLIAEQQLKDENDQMEYNIADIGIKSVAYRIKLYKFFTKSDDQKITITWLNHDEFANMKKLLKTLL